MNDQEIERLLQEVYKQRDKRLEKYKYIPFIKTPRIKLTYTGNKYIELPDDVRPVRVGDW
jgi:hypothetical protein